MTTANLLWWFVTVVFVTPQLGVHLQMHIFKVDLATDVLHVTFGDIIT